MPMPFSDDTPEEIVHHPPKYQRKIIPFWLLLSMATIFH